MRANQCQNIEYTRTLELGLLCSLIVSLAMMADSPYELKMAWESQSISVYYLFFDTIIFAGMFENYFAAIICAFPFSKTYLQDYNSGRLLVAVYHQGKARYLRKQFLTGALGSGLCLSLGYLLFILILSARLPFINAQDIDSGLSTLPYIHYSLEGNTQLHKLIILYYGFLTGSLWGAVTMMSSAYFHDRLTVMAIPFFTKFIIIQTYRIFVIPSTYRLDSWLYMFTICQSELFTLIASTICVAVVTLTMYVIFKGKVLTEVFYEKRTFSM